MECFIWKTKNEAFKSFNGKPHCHIEIVANSILRQYPLGKAAYMQEIEKCEKEALQERLRLAAQKLLP